MKDVNFALHPDLAHLAFLLGTWVGDGSGQYPTIAPFDYHETLTFSHAGKPALGYRQETTLAADGTLSHLEAGFLRPVGENGIELVLAHPSGLAEVSEGRVEGTSLRLVSTAVTKTTTAKDVTKIERDLDVDVAAGVLRYQLRMRAVGQELAHHLSAELHRR